MPSPVQSEIQQVRELSWPFQRHITDVQFFKLALYTQWCGWRVKEAVKITKKLGMESRNVTREIVVNPKTRIMNEDCADYIYGKALPLISHILATGKMTDLQIFNEWNGLIDSVVWTLARICYGRKGAKNYYDLVPNRLGDVTSTLASMAGMTYKSSGGFTLSKLAETLITQNINQNQVPTITTKQPGIINRILGTK
jgi:hypothetical protein